MSDLPSIECLTPAVVADVCSWRIGGAAHVVAVVKATFELVPDGPMRPSAPEPLRWDELVPYLPGAAISFVGRAYPRGRDAEARLALFASGGAQQALVDKTISVLGAEGSSSGVLLPADAASYRPSVSFAPMASDWPVREALLGHRKETWLRQSMRLVDEAFDWSYFRPVPPEQMAPFLQGDEWLLLEGLHPTQPALRTQLPGARASVRVSLPLATGGPPPLEVRADMLLIDGDRGLCSVVWRGAFPVADESAIEDHSIWVTLGLPGQRMDEWPPVDGELASSLAPALAAGAGGALAAASPAVAPPLRQVATEPLAAASPPVAPVPAPRTSPTAHRPSPWQRAAPPAAAAGAPVPPGGLAAAEGSRTAAPGASPPAGDALAGTVGLTTDQQASAGKKGALPFGRAPAGTAKKRPSPFATGREGNAPAAKRPSPFAGRAQAPPGTPDKTVAIDSFDPLSGTLPLSGTQHVAASARRAVPFGGDDAADEVRAEVQGESEPPDPAAHRPAGEAGQEPNAPDSET